MTEEGTPPNKKRKKKQPLQVFSHGMLETIDDVEDWPDGNMYVRIFQQHKIPFVDPVRETNPSYWQACVRWALMKKFGCLLSGTTTTARNTTKIITKHHRDNDYNNNIKDGEEGIDVRLLKDMKYQCVGEDDNDGGARRGILPLDSRHIQCIAKQWKLTHQTCQATAASDDDKDAPRSSNNTNNNINENDLFQFLHCGGKSNNRRMQMALMMIPPGYKLHCHAHPNIELAYCVQGKLHEIRLSSSSPPSSSSTNHNQDPDAAGGGQLLLVDRMKYYKMDEKDKTKNTEHGGLEEEEGPNLDNVKEEELNWTLSSIQAGEWLVNEIGSIHKSFTSKTEGCTLILLFGGSEANIHEPHQHQQRLEEMIECVETEKDNY